MRFHRLFYFFSAGYCIELSQSSRRSSHTDPATEISTGHFNIIGLTVDSISVDSISLLPIISSVWTVGEEIFVSKTYLVDQIANP